MKAKEWGFTQTWNKTLEEGREQREPKPRKSLWASELGKAHIDLYLRLNGVAETNPPNTRALRKFEAGNIWEWILGLILKRAGILKDEQAWLSYQYPNMLEVTGRLDFLAGGVPDTNAIAELEKLELPDIFLRAGKNIVEYFNKNYPEGLEDKILEIKSTSAFMFEVYERSRSASDNHIMQTMHYLKAKNLERGAVVYVCRDDCRMLEFPVSVGGPQEKMYEKAIADITDTYNKGVEPPKESLIVFEKGKFTKNWKVGYSGYLTKLYGFKTPADFDDAQAPKTARWNRVIGRAVKGEKMTENNLSAIGELESEGFVWKDILPEAKKINGNKPEPENEEVNIG